MQNPQQDPVPHFVTLEGSANALATNKDASQVVVAGRNVFKIFYIESNKFLERLNVRIGKNVDLSYSSADVVWSPCDDSVLATAATNGSVVTWNLNSSLKQDLKFQDHKRTVNKVCFHATEAHYLLSGSQDGTMKLFDLRTGETTSTFYSLSESVRDVQFSPHMCFWFAAVQENGYVQLWDLRRTDRFHKQFAAHSGPAFTCDWHPEEKYLFATAGRDKTIKIWDTNLKENLEHCIQTIASVSRVKWRPDYKYHIANSSLVVDYAVNVWDVRRPFVPLASFPAHKDVATGFAWRSPTVLVSTAKDCTLHQHTFESASRPGDMANQMGLNFDPSGDLSFAFSRAFLRPEPSSTPKSSATALFSPTSTPRVINSLMRKASAGAQDRFKSSLSLLTVLRNGHELLSMDWFMETAKLYRLHGLPIPELCEHNANVALNLGRSDISQSWLVLKLLYTSGSVLISEFSHIVNQDKMQEDKALESSQEAPGNKHRSLRSHHNSSKSGSRHVSGGSQERSHGENHAEEDSDSGNTEHENTITYFSSEITQGDFFFGDGEPIFSMLDFSQISSLPADEDWTLPREAFNVRHQLGDGSPPPEIANMPSPQLCNAGEVCEREYTPNEEEEQNMILALNNAQRFPPWDFTKSVVDMLTYYADLGDVQMSVSVLLVLGEKIRYIVDETLQEQWFYSYLDLLSRFKLWNISNEVIALSSLPSINSQNQQSTVVHTLCSKCNKIINSVGWCCDNCKEMPLCSICHQVVRGLFVWCQGCAHGGHLSHLQDWFGKHTECPTGCGHLCEYT